MQTATHQNETLATKPAKVFDVQSIRGDFPILNQQVNGHPLAYLDNAATAQTPVSVHHSVARFEESYRANIHRGIHCLSGLATDAYEDARCKVRRFIGADDAKEVIFTRGTTESINLVAAGVRETLNPGDEIVVTELEHHSNSVPWQIAAERSGATVKWARVDSCGALDVDHLKSLLSKRTRVVAVTHTSNALGTVVDVAEISRLAHGVGAWVVVDGAQGVPHAPIDVKALGADFFAFSGHKMYGPMGIGVLYGRLDLLNELPPYAGGGGMIDKVSPEGTTFLSSPERFEAGTPNVSGAIGLGAAIDYIESIGITNLARHEASILSYLESGLENLGGVRRFGQAPNRAAVCSFEVKDIHHHDLATLLDQQGIAVRTGHHCNQPLMARLGVTGTVRASVAAYTNHEDIDRLIAGLAQAKEVFGL